MSIRSGQQVWTPIGGAESAANSPLASDAGQYLRVSVSYTDGHGPFKNAQLIVVGEVLEYTGPLFVGTDAGSISLSVQENATGDTTVGEPVTAESGNETITYELSGPDAGLFTVDVESGQIRVADGALLDYEQGNSAYGLTLTATDGLGQTASVTVTIQLTNIELPALAGRYDTDNDERISRAEALAAVVDYFAGITTGGRWTGCLRGKAGVRRRVSPRESRLFEVLVFVEAGPPAEDGERGRQDAVRIVEPELDFVLIEDVADRDREAV